jgi:hypothetical protein
MAVHLLSLESQINSKASAKETQFGCCTKTAGFAVSDV